MTANFVTNLNTEHKDLALIKLSTKYFKENVKREKTNR